MSLKQIICYSPIKKVRRKLDILIEDKTVTKVVEINFLGVIVYN